MIRLVIADDHPIIINGIKTLLEKEEDIKLINEVNDGVELLKLLEGTEVDVVLMDINMPEMNGVDATKMIHSSYPNTKILAFSQYNEKRFVKRMLKCGASGYLLKNSSAIEIITAIKMVNGGGIYLSEDLPNIFDNRKTTVRSNSLFPGISTRELDVLNLICDGLNTQEIADKLFISKHTVETHRANLLLKVGTKNTAGLVSWAVVNEIV